MGRAWVFGVSMFANVFCAAVNCYTWRLGYPLWGFAGKAFGPVHREYMARLTPVITVPHVVMFFASLGAAVWPAREMPGWVGWVVFALDTAVIAVSVLVAGPVHDRFTRSGFDDAGLRRLVTVSAWRSVMMLAACGLLVWRVVRVFGQ